MKILICYCPKFLNRRRIIQLEEQTTKREEHRDQIINNNEANQISCIYRRLN